MLNVRLKELSYNRINVIVRKKIERVLRLVSFIGSSEKFCGFYGMKAGLSDQVVYGTFCNF